jgi:hypothetical protein
MRVTSFRCPTTGQQVQGTLPDIENIGPAVFEAVACQACSRIHLVNAKTGKPIGYRDETKPQ